jgi:hypothetical protein
MLCGEHLCAASWSAVVLQHGCQGCFSIRLLM